VVAGQRVRLRVEPGGDPWFQIVHRQGFDLGRLVGSLRRRVGAAEAE
jgi:hypothetical protein